LHPDKLSVITQTTIRLVCATAKCLIVSLVIGISIRGLLIHHVEAINRSAELQTLRCLAAPHTVSPENRRVVFAGLSEVAHRVAAVD
jgi:hypothetical protein